MARLPFEVGLTPATSTTAWMVSFTRTGPSTFCVHSSIAMPVPWIMVCRMKPSISE